MCLLKKKSREVIIVLLICLFMPAWGLIKINQETLPAPVIHPHSFELLANSRYSVHAGFEGRLPVQVLANILWAMSHVPHLGGYQELYVATEENVYLYQPESRTLTVHLPGDHRYNSGSAFEVGVATPRHEEAGMAVQAGLLAAIAFWDDTAEVVCCPMKWAADYANRNWHPRHEIKMVNVFGRAPARGLDTTLVAISSDSSLPPPFTNGTDTFELILMDLTQDSVFSNARLSLETVSQLLWAGYGVTPHITTNGRQGLVVPSALAGYFLTSKIYLVREEGVDRYYNRLPGDTNLRTKDHRLERFVWGDRRNDLRLACERVPSSAPVYIVVCVNDTSSYRTMQEAGFVAFNLLMQARALGLGGYITMPLTPQERSAIKNALLLPTSHHPVFVFSCGELAAGIKGQAVRPGVVQIVRAQPAVRKGNLKVEYLLRQPALVQAEVFDLLGRPVKTIFEEKQAPGYHSFIWDGTNEQGRPVRRGSYLITISAGGNFAQHKVTWAR
ncbi:MAG: FlgD immunoglobulin-like domain containing protein [candidate division WOR-3 bacterium]